MADDNRPLKYMRYAVGEIVLVVIGILIALSINNWNEQRLDRIQEIIILKNIKKDLSQDTLDMNFNIEQHKKILNNEKKLLDFMMSNHLEPIDNINYSDALGFALLIELHESTYNNIQNNDLGILTNNSLNRKIARFYDFYAEALLKVENSELKFNFYASKKQFFKKHFKLDKKSYVLDSIINTTEDYYNPGTSKREIEILDFERLKNDEPFKIELNESIFIRKFKIDFYINNKKNIAELITAINEELKSFEN